ncbi:hypothetical protein SELMODRAFT_406139 [Selaginella moellendorffii]|uniref:Bifunctional inhibitor/plant lipid transfer protein/seed storage helical domain-containing protein n=1 Tax=Selaginella moellendorffii TaxID=88036 RepID=D8R1E1_SELML|nr:hypothetical protein SELMODRAFT_406139 [Selaginella moellendorffii]
MDQKTVTTLLKAFFVVAALAASASADPDQQPPCNTFMSVLSCQSATMSESTMPSPACCAALRKFHDADCLCQVLLSARSAAAIANVPFNLKAALEIPMKCALRTVSAPPGYSCGGMVVPRSPPPTST